MGNAATAKRPGPRPLPGAGAPRARAADDGAGRSGVEHQVVIPGRASARTRNLAPSTSGFRVRCCASPRNDEGDPDSNFKQQIRVRILAARFARAMLETCASEKQRAQGRPGARCTRGLVRERKRKKPHTSIQVQRKHPAFPAQWLYGLLRALPGESGFVVSVAPKKLASRELDASH